VYEDLKVKKEIFKKNLIKYVKKVQY